MPGRTLKLMGWSLGFGFLIGGLRGIVEAWVVSRRFPLHQSDFGPTIGFFLQVFILYAAAIGLAGGILFVIFHTLWGKRKWTWMAPVSYLIVIVSIDLIPRSFMNFDSQIRRSIAEIVPEKHFADLILITIDTCRADHLAVYGYPQANTPFLNRLSGRGAVFADAVTSIPVTTPSHVSILTGCSPPVHGSRFNAVPIGSSTVPISELLKNEGYITAAFVSAFPLVHEVSGLSKGFYLYDQMLTPRHLDPLFYQTSCSRLLAELIRLLPAERQCDQVIHPVIRWWDQVQKTSTSRPLFTWVHFYDPHAPYEPSEICRRMFSDEPPSDVSLHRIRALNSGEVKLTEEITRQFTASYDGEISAVDRAIETLWIRWSAMNRNRPVVFAVIGDHGESLTEHGYYFSHGDNIMDPSLRIPLIISQPGTIGVNQVIGMQVSGTDLMPTLLNLLGMKVPSSCDGIDLSGALTGMKAVHPKLVFCESGAGVYLAPHRPPIDKIRQKERGVRNGKEKLVFFMKGKHSYFDLAADPGETDPMEIAGFKEREELSGILGRYIELDVDGDNQMPEMSDKRILEQLRGLGYIE